ncbi:MAG: tRNA pseudouridine(55) synthase TruB [Clostridiales Family XIII bacterium]|jgi:tRNA pseudouridine55 synthase|nr:tRNA pseudouridine(55) synthase TruB [Clostridiales Family XIII bacterium]
MANSDGIIVIDKPQGMTSHDVVGFVRRALGMRRVGHTGTLDPMARGVLPICVGKATRIIEFIDADDSADAKAYDCEMRLGVVTDTLDVWGSVIGEAQADAAHGIDGGAVEGVLAAMTGELDQIPPAYSAIKYKGKKLYELARRGEEIPEDAVKPRRVRIGSIVFKGISFDADGHPASNPGFATVRFSVVCSKGTYVRSIVRDAGDALGCGAAMSALTRTKSGVFTLDDAGSHPGLPSGNAESGDMAHALLPMDSAIPYLPEIRLAEADARRFKSGLRFRAKQAAGGGACSYAFTRVYESSEFIGIAKIEEDIVKPYKVITS